MWVNWVLSTLFSPGSSWDDASDLGHNPAHLNETCTEPSAWHSPLLYPSFVLGGSSIFGGNYRPSFKCHRREISVAGRPHTKKKSEVLSHRQLGAFSGEGHR